MINVHFGEIRAKIIDLLEEAEIDIKVGMAWLTNKALFQILLNKAAAGKRILVVISDSPTNFRIHDSGKMKIDFEALIRKGGEVKVIKNYKSAFFHNKFVVIDEKKVITGSYNWSYSAESNYENIIVTDDIDTVKDFGIMYDHFHHKKAIAYDKFIADFRTSYTSFVESLEIRDDQTYLLAEEFERLVQENIEKGRHLGIRVNFDRLQNKIVQYTAVGAARKLVNGEAQTGFIEIAAIHRLDLSFEYLVSQERFASLFDKTTIRNAQEKLRAYGFNGRFDELQVIAI